MAVKHDCRGAVRPEDAWAFDGVNRQQIRRKFASGLLGGAEAADLAPPWEWGPVRSGPCLRVRYLIVIPGSAPK